MTEEIFYDRFTHSKLRLETRLRVANDLMVEVPSKESSPFSSRHLLHQISEAVRKVSFRSFRIAGIRNMS